MRVRFLGGCKGCPLSQMTLKMGIESVLQEWIPEVKEVVAIQEELCLNVFHETNFRNGQAEIFSSRGCDFDYFFGFNNFITDLEIVP